jgi:AraC-like DNA-binding protein
MRYSVIQFLHGGYYPDCGSRVNKYFSDYYTLQYMTEGKVHLAYGSRKRSLEGACFWFTYPGPRFRYQADRNSVWEHRYIAFRGTLAAEWRANGLIGDDPQPVPHGVDYTCLFDELIRTSHIPDLFEQNRALNILERILLDLHVHRTEPRQREEWIDQVIDELNTRLSDGIDYTEISRACNLGESTLRRKFRHATGTPIHTYYLQLKIGKARELLADSRLTVKNIAQQLGYKDVYFFTRQFRKLTGSTPGTYRKSVLG